MNKIISIIPLVLLIGFACYSSVFDNVKLEIAEESKVSKQDLVDELTSEQETISKPFNNIKITEWLLPEIKAFNKKLKEYGNKKNNDTLICINDSLKYEKRISSNKTIIKHLNLFK